MVRPRTRPFCRGFWPLGLLLSFGLLCQNLSAQTPTRRNPSQRTTLPKSSISPGADQPKLKAIWEPVNYADDIALQSVFFVSENVGWAGGYSARPAGSDSGGVLIHTTDGGEHWDLQLGDPESPQAGFSNLYFLDATHGWVTQKYKLLHTSDGVNWEEAGSLPQGGLSKFVFTSPRHGIGISEGQFIAITEDGGRTWKRTFQCAVRLQVNGLTQNSGCKLNALHFPSPTIGYAAGGGDGFVAVAKTEDGGTTWKIISSATGDSQASGIFFTDENTGFMRVNGTKLQATSDGGQTWRGVPTPVPDRWQIQFADPEVGWICGDRSMAFSGDSGHRWNSRDFHFPADVNGWSFPRRDRAYVVGWHGMIYRYRVVSVTYQAKAHSLDAPLMPGIDSPVFVEVATMNDVIAKLRTKLPALPATGSGGSQLIDTSGGGVPGAAGAGGFQQDTTGPSTNVATTGSMPGGAASGFQQDLGSGPVTGGYMDSCCGPLMQQLENTANSFATSAPAYSQRFRNLNLILEGLNLVNTIVGQANTLKQSIRALRQAKDQQAAAAAFSKVQTQVNGISSSSGFVQDVSMPPQP